MADGWHFRPGIARRQWDVGEHLAAAWPAVAFGLRLWVAVCLALFVAFELELENPSWAGTSAAIVCQPILGASLRKGWFRLVGTIIGAIFIIFLSAGFPESRGGFLIGLSLWLGVCAFMATILRNFASYAAALAGYTAAIIAGDELGAVGGTSGDVFNLAVSRATEICIGIVCAGIVMAVTDLGGARRKLATLLNTLSAEVAAGMTETLGLPTEMQAASRTRRRQILVQVTGLDTVIDQAAGEITTLPFHPRTLQRAVDSLFAAIGAWRAVATHLEFHPEASAEAAAVQACLPPVLTELAVQPAPPRWTADPRAIQLQLREAARRLVATRVENPSLQLLFDRTAEGLLALTRTMDGLIVLERPRLAQMPRRVGQLRVPDILPPLINAIRAFATIAVASLVWIVTAWPSGAIFITFAAVGVTLFAPMENAAYMAARRFTVGTILTAACAAIVAFALLPAQSTFAGFCAVLGLVLVPAGALSAQPWEQGVFIALEANFIPLLGPSNPMSYDPQSFYNLAFGLLGGIGFAMLGLRLIPPMAPQTRARRLLALTLRDLRRLTRGRIPASPVEWDADVYGRLSAVPDAVDPLQAARLAAALSVGGDIIRLRHIARRFSLIPVLEQALAAIRSGDSAAAIVALHRFDAALADVPATRPGARIRLRARATIRAIADALTQHESYFDARVPP